MSTQVRADELKVGDTLGSGARVVHVGARRWEGSFVMVDVTYRHETCPALTGSQKIWARTTVEVVR